MTLRAEEFSSGRELLGWFFRAEALLQWTVTRVAAFVEYYP